METGSVNAYIVHENWAFTPFLLFARCLLENIVTDGEIVMKPLHQLQTAGPGQEGKQAAA